MLKGFEIGKISRISLNSQNEVDVRFSIEDTYYDKVTSQLGPGAGIQPHRAGQHAEVPPRQGSRTAGAGDGLHPDPRQRRRPTTGGGELVDIPKGEDVIGSVIAKLNPLLDEAQSTILEFKKVATTVDNGLSGRGGPIGTMVNDLSTTPGRVNRTVDSMSGKIDTLLDKVSVIADNLTDISVKTRGVIGDFSTNLDEISQNLKQMTGDLKNTQGLVKRLLDPKGSIDTFLNDSNELYNQVDTALKNANAIILQLKSFAEFINDTRPQVSNILEKGSTTLSSANDVLEAAKNNPLLKGGVPPRAVPATPLSSYRDEDF